MSLMYAEEFLQQGQNGGLIVQCFDHEGSQATKGTTGVTGIKCLFIFIIN